jgi:hypothetical protein
MCWKEKREMSAAAYQLMDIDSASLLGSFASEHDALRAVAAAAARYGRGSEAVMSLVLFRQDVPEAEGFIAQGTDLVERAIAATDAERAAAR